MGNPVCASISDLAEALRSLVERREHSTASSESIAEVADILTVLASTLREDLNSRIPMFKLPVEVLQKIIEKVPDPLFVDPNDFRPSWRSNAMNTRKLIPLLQTCRQLRRIALSHKSLWKTVDPTGQYALPSFLLQKGCDVPLIAVIDGSDASQGRGEALGDLDEEDVQRMQELHVSELYMHYLPDDMLAKVHRYFGAGLPLLESLSLTQVLTHEAEDWHIDEGECPFQLEHAPRLRRLMLQNVTFTPKNAFPHLTHLALEEIHTPDCHTDTAGLLSRCPSLETVAIHSESLPDTTPRLPEGFSPPLSLTRLRRITLQLPHFPNPVMDFYLSLFPFADPALQPIALQIVELAAEDNIPALGRTLGHVTKGEASHLTLSLHPHPRIRNQQYLSVTAAGPKGTFHVSAEASWADVSPLGPLDIFPGPFLDAVLCGCAHLRAVRELWVTGVPPRTGRRLYRDAAAHFRKAVAALPALETVVLVVVPEVGAQSELETDLGVLPGAHDPGFAAPPNLKTLRILYGTDAPTGKESVEKTRLTGLLDQLGAGAYGYFESVLLQMTRQLEVDEEDLARLEARFKSVTFQHIDRMPAMPLPEYCTEPDAGPGGTSTWHGSLW